MDDLNAIRLAESCQFKKDTRNIACDFACGGWKDLCNILQIG